MTGDRHADRYADRQANHRANRRADITSANALPLSAIVTAMTHRNARAKAPWDTKAPWDNGQRRSVTTTILIGSAALVKSGICILSAPFWAQALKAPPLEWTEHLTQSCVLLSWKDGPANVRRILR